MSIKYKAVDYFTDYVIAEGDVDTVSKKVNEWYNNNGEALVEIYKFTDDKWVAIT